MINSTSHLDLLRISIPQKGQRVEIWIEGKEFHYSTNDTEKYHQLCDVFTEKMPDQEIIEEAYQPLEQQQDHQQSKEFIPAQDLQLGQMKPQLCDIFRIMMDQSYEEVGIFNTQARNLQIPSANPVMINQEGELENEQELDIGSYINFDLAAFVQTQLSLFHNFLAEPQRPGRKKNKKTVSKKLEHFFRDIKKGFIKQLQIQTEKYFDFGDQLKDKTVEFLDRIIAAAEDITRKKRTETWKSICFEQNDSLFKQLILKCLSKKNYEKMINGMTNIHKKQYLMNRVPLLVYLQTGDHEQYVKFRNYYQLHRKSE